MKWIWPLLSLIAILTTVDEVSSNQDLLVETTYGVLRGTYIYVPIPSTGSFESSRSQEEYASSSVSQQSKEYGQRPIPHGRGHTRPFQTQKARYGRKTRDSYWKNQSRRFMKHKQRVSDRYTDSQKLRGYGFFGVPFAAPPIWNLRFAPPQEPLPWEGVRDATHYGPACPQNMTYAMLGSVLDFSKASDRLRVTSSENCLHLNIYTPALTGSRPVMVWIHGGSLQRGWASMYDGRSLALLKDVVMVTIQYRLGPLGFLNTGDGTVRGNMGLMDQVAALQWIQRNIDRFGGDPQQVTIFGESAGSMSGSFHLVSPRSRGLFHRLILQSGSLAGSFYFSPPVDVPGLSMAFAHSLGCVPVTVESMLECLREVSDTTLFWKENGVPQLYVPSIDGDYLPGDPATLLLEGQYNKEVDVILGVAAIEGYLLTTQRDQVYSNPILPVFHHVMKEGLGLLLPHKADHLEQMVAAILNEYGTGDDLGRAIAECVGDVLITKDVYHTVKTLTANGEGRLYFYEFRQRPSISLKPPYIQADHGDILYYCFGESHTEMFQGFSGMVRTQEDRDVEDIIVGYWTNFAKNGDPNGDGLPDWPAYRCGSYMKLQVEPQAAVDYRPDNMRFWMETFPEAAGDLPIQFPKQTSPIPPNC